MAVRLGELHVGETGRIVGFDRGVAAYRQKLLAMGLTPGTEFSVIRVAPLGDPVEIRIRGTELSLRKGEISALRVERIATPSPSSEARDTEYVIAIAGNPNAGKSSLFNGLTGASQYVGNWPGVTGEKRLGHYQFAGNTIQVVDLPGIYSLDMHAGATAPDEQVARDYLLSGKANLIVNIVDTSHLEHNLYLTTQLLELKVPMLVVLNVMEDSQGRGLRGLIDTGAFARHLGCRVVALAATRAKEVEALKAEIQRFTEQPSPPIPVLKYPVVIEEAIAELLPTLRKSCLLGLSGPTLACYPLARRRQFCPPPCGRNHPGRTREGHYRDSG